MDQKTKEYFAHLWGSDREKQNAAFYHFLDVTNEPVDWAYEAWDEVLTNLTHKDNHNRAIAGQLLCALAKSDPDSRLLQDFDALFAVTYDERFVTARHTMQALWKVGVVNKALRRRYLAEMDNRFDDCISQKQCTLIRYDILQSLRNVFDLVGDEAVRTAALAWIEREQDLKYRAKYRQLWKNT